MAVTTGITQNESDEKNDQHDDCNEKKDLPSSEKYMYNEMDNVTNSHVKIEILYGKDGSHICMFINEKELELYNIGSGASVICLYDAKEKNLKGFSKENGFLEESESICISLGKKQMLQQSDTDTERCEKVDIDVQRSQEIELNSDGKIITKNEPETNRCVIPRSEYQECLDIRMGIVNPPRNIIPLKNAMPRKVSAKRGSLLHIHTSQSVGVSRNSLWDYFVIFCSFVTSLEILEKILMLLAMPKTQHAKADRLLCLSSGIKKMHDNANRYKSRKFVDWLTTHHIEKTKFTQPSFMNVITVYPLGADLRSFMSVTGKTLEKMMDNEWIRLSTFVGFPRDCPVSTMRLSDAGFYYPGSGNDDEVACFKCGVKYKGWKREDVPVLVHKTISPSCLFIQDKSPPTGDEYGPRPQNIQQRRENRIPVTGSGPQEPGNVGGARGGPSDTQQITSKVSEVNLQGSNEPPKTGNEKQSSRPVLAGSQPPESSAISNPANFASTSQSSTSIETSIAQSSPNISSSGSATQNISSGNNESTSTLPASGSGSSSQEPASSTAPTAIPPAIEPLGVTTIKPKYPNFAVYVNRLQTYKGFPKDLNQKPEDLAKAGFFYEGKSDNVRCFYCGGGLRDWEPEDDVWIEHARWYQKCVYVRQSKGDEFIRLVHSGQYEILKKERELKKAAEQKKKEVMRLPAVVSVIEMGYHENLVKQAYQKCAAEHGDGNVTAEVLIQMVWQLEEEGQTNLGSETETTTTETEQSPHEASGGESQPQTTPVDLPPSETGEQANSESVDELAEENRILKEQQMCKICMEEEAAIVFLPCGHMVTCVACAAAMRHCPICRTFIRGTIKAIVC